MKTRNLLIPTLLAALALVAAPLRAQEGAPEKKKAGKEKAARKDKDAAAEPAGGANAVTIPWDGQTLRGQQIIKRLYRLKKSNQWAPDRLPKLCQLVLDSGYQPFFKFAKFYQALIAGHDGQNAEALRLLKEAVSLGYKNAIEIGEAAEFAALQELPEFKSLLGGIEKELKERQIRNYTSCFAKGLEQGLAEPPAPWGEGLQTVDQKPFWIDGQAMVVVVSKLEDDRLEKYIPLLRSLKLPAPLGVILFDYFPKAKARVAKFAEKLGLNGVPVAAISREEYLKLRQSFQRHFETAQKAKERFEDEEEEVFLELLPFTTVFDSGHRPVHSLAGVQDRWELEIAVAQVEGAIAKLVPPGAEKPTEPPPAAVDTPKPAEPATADPPKPEEPKAETPKPEPPTPPPGEAKPAPLPPPPPDAPKPEEPKKPTETPAPAPLDPKKPAEPEKKAEPAETKPADSPPPEKS